MLAGRRRSLSRRGAPNSQRRLDHELDAPASKAPTMLPYCRMLGELLKLPVLPKWMVGERRSRPRRRPRAHQDAALSLLVELRNDSCCAIGEEVAAI